MIIPKTETLNAFAPQKKLECQGYEAKLIDVTCAFDHPPPPPDFVLPSLVAGTVGSVVAPGGVGKSMLALGLSVFVATGVDLTGFARGCESKTGKVTFLSAEDGENSTLHRLYALGQLLSPSQQKQFAENFEIRQLIGMRITIEEPSWQAFVESMASGRRLLIMDTFRRFHESKENDSEAMSPIMSALEGIAERTGCAIVFLHHTNKSSVTNGQGDTQHASKGSAVLVDHPRWQMYLVGMSDDEADKLKVEKSRRAYYVRVGLSKINYGPPRLNACWLERSKGGVLVAANLPIASAIANKGSRRAEA